MSWAARLVPACQELADALTAGGVPATLDRAKLPVPGAWVRPDRASPDTLSGAGTARVSVLLVTADAGDLPSLTKLAGLLELALAVVDPAADEAVDTSVVLPHNTNALPAFRLAVDLELEESE